MNYSTIIPQLTIDELTGQLMHHAPSIPRFGIREYHYWNEGLHGVARAGKATVFPQAIGLASTFDPNLIQKMATVIGKEARVKFNLALRYHPQVPIYQGLHLWSPVLNVFRDPRWGRGQETYGEDPLLIAKLGTAYVKGLQRKLDGKYPLADATIKHAFVHSGPEANRQQFNAEVTDEDLESTYLPAFKSVIQEAKPSGVMMAYNRINGVPCVIAKTWIEEVIRNQGFQGYIVSDCQAVESLHRFHGATSSMEESVLATIRAGLDLTCGNNQEALKRLIENGQLNKEDLYPSLSRIWQSRQRLGIDDLTPPYQTFNEALLECPEHQRLNLKIAESSVVLLKNEGLLPLFEDPQRLAVIGNNAHNIHALTGNYHGRSDTWITPYLGIKKVFKKSDVRYAQGCEADPVIHSWLEQPLNEAKSLMDWAEIIILVLGLDARYEGEENDASRSPLNGDKATLSLSASQMALIKAAQASQKPIILVNISGSPLIMPTAGIDAVIQQFYGGSLAGLALARVLSGKTNPSGKLPVTFVDDESLLPPITSYAMAKRTYRYSSTLPLYTFGYGLNYDRTRILSVERKQDHVIFKLENPSTYLAKPVLQIYQFSTNPKNPKRTLIAFKKIKMMRNEIKVVSIKVEALKSNDALFASLNGPNTKEVIAIG